MTIDCVCFDLDDTLYEYEQYARAGLSAAADRLETRTGTNYHDELESLYFDEETTEGTFDVLIERHDLDEGIVPDLIEAYHDASSPLTPYSETEPVLTELSQEYSLGLITDGRGGWNKLERLGIEPYFDSILVTPTIGHSKHERLPFERTLEALSVRASSAAYVGDDPRVDFRVPNELGMVTVRCRRGRFSELEATDARGTPDHELETLEMLPVTLEQGTKAR